MWTKVSLPLSVLASVALVAAGPSAMADPYPLDAGPDTGVHTFCFEGAYPMVDAVKSRARYSMDNNDGVEAQTVVSTREYADGANGYCGTSIDVAFEQRYIGEGILGYTPCRVLNSLNNRCDSHEVRIAWGEIKQYAANDGFEARHTLCHEIGHSLGASHYSQGGSPDVSSNSCLISGVWDSGAAWTRSYGAHHRAHIAAWW